MGDHTVTVGEAGSPSEIHFSSVFNVAVAMIDRHLAAGREDKAAFVTADGAVTYRALAERVGRAGNAVRDLGLGPGDRVLMAVTDGPEFVYLFFGAIKAGTVPVAVNTLLHPADYTHFVDDSRCVAAVVSPAVDAAFREGLSGAAHAPDHVVPTAGSGGLAERMARAAPELAPAASAPGDDCFWLYSSGSTGFPKGVVHAHRDMVVTSQRYGVETLGLGEDDVIFSMSKLFHSYGFGNAMTFPLWVGATAVLSDTRVSPEMTFETFERFRPTVYFGVPTLYAQQLKHMETADPDLDSLRICVSAGEALPADLFRRWRERTGISLLDGIGSTEVLHIFISNTEADCRPGTSGRPVPGYEIRLVDEAGDPVPDGEIGTIRVRGDSCARYYWNNPEKTARTMVDGWLDTGDMYYRDGDGYYVNCGRGDDMLKVGGLWCSPFEIEARLVEHPAVLEAAVVARTDDDGLVKPAAHVVLEDPGTAGDAMDAALRDHCRAGLAGYKYPRWIDFVDALPKTATGKIQRFRLRGEG